MGHYKANSTNSRNFTLTQNDSAIGELKYAQWYSFKAEIALPDDSGYQLEPRGFWNSKIELSKNGKLLCDFEIGWKGIVISTHFDAIEKSYLLKLKGLLGNKYILVDTAENELLAAVADFKWNKLNFDYDLETSNRFDGFENKELLLLTILHCINYYIAFVSSSG
jgi:hypothetical protein